MSAPNFEKKTRELKLSVAPKPEIKKERKKAQPQLRSLLRLPANPSRRKTALTFLASIANKPTDSHVLRSLHEIDVTTQDLKYVWYKELTVTDVDNHQRRLFLPKDCAVLLADELTAEEKDKVDARGMEITVMGHDGRRWEGAVLHQWTSVGSGGQLVLRHNWYRIVSGVRSRKATLLGSGFFAMAKTRDHSAFFLPPWNTSRRAAELIRLLIDHAC